MTDVSDERLLKKIVGLLRESPEIDSNELLGADTDVLKQKVNAFLADSDKFKPGDIVRWKKGLKNRKYPKENQSCYVINVLENPIIQDARDPGSPYYREPLDLVLALLDEDSDLVLFHYDKRRFEKV